MRPRFEVILSQILITMAFTDSKTITPILVKSERAANPQSWNFPNVNGNYYNTWATPPYQYHQPDFHEQQELPMKYHSNGQNSNLHVKPTRIFSPIPVPYNHIKNHPMYYDPTNMQRLQLPGTFSRRTDFPISTDHDYPEKIQKIVYTINNWFGAPGLGFGTNGTSGLIGDINEIINDVSKIIIEKIRFKLKFLQHLIDAKSNFFHVPTLLEKLDDFALKLEKFMTYKFGPEYGEFTRNFHTCMRKSFQCHFLPVLSSVCLTHCALTSIPASSPVAILVDFWTKSLEKILQFICNPIHTFFHLSWKFYMKHLAAGSVYSLTDSMTSMGLNMEELIGVEFERLVPLTMTRILRPIRRTFQPVDIILGSFEKLILLFKKFNPACWALEVKLAPKYFVELFNYNPRMIDTLLGGVIFVSTLVQGLPLPGTRRQSVQRFHKILDIVTGMNCGVIFWTRTNGSAICDQRKNIVSSVNV